MNNCRSAGAEPGLVSDLPVAKSPTGY